MKRTWLKPRSAKYRRSQAELAAMWPAIRRDASGKCQAQFSVFCTGGADVPHHLLKRTHSRYRHERAFIIATCTVCNGAIEDDHDQAVARGLTIESWMPSWFAREARERGLSEHATQRALEETARVAWQCGSSFEATGGIFFAAHDRAGGPVEYRDISA